MKQEIAEVERRTDDDVAAVQLPRDQAPAVSPVEQAVAATLGDTVELSSQSADVGEPHHLMLAGHRACAFDPKDLLKKGSLLWTSVRECHPTTFCWRAQSGRCSAEPARADALQFDFAAVRKHET
jgi:hypothetical protein